MVVMCDVRRSRENEQAWLPVVCLQHVSSGSFSPL